MRFSALRVLTEALRGHRGWKPLWRDPDPQPAYDYIIIGGGGHGLATAYYLANTFRKSRIAVLEKGWLGQGNIGRNTTIIRSNYLLPGNEPFYEFSMNAYRRRGNAMLLAGADAELLDREQLRAMIPFLNFDNARFPIKGGLLQRRAGTARHDGVAWGYARGADQAGVDLIQNCEVTGLRIEAGRIRGVETSRGYIGATKVGVAVAGSTSRVMAQAGLRMPIESHVLQAFVSEGLKPLIPGVITFGAGHFYVSQSDKGGLVFGGDIDGYNSYAQRGNLPVIEDVAEGGMALMPMIGRARLLRIWGGIMDMSMDGSPIIDRTPIDGLYLNAGWCYGGFKATPASGYAFAHLLATDNPHQTATAYRLDRFARGYVIDEKGAGAQPNLH
jgi:heterotetrameric sarcosine oxidase beta subunit